ncbi:hypothetical protein [Colwellia echini]|uniref:Uncharacterized protein n=1 Tax=Colwellia echini TaxID=1982103 RepID=A0ABY3MWU1_9GAMM|nr:hypothetical protein [Colwellia echini]TYK65644.1 hypothetical protein CWS31_009795 [Colwellia echini]
MTTDSNQLISQKLLAQWQTLHNSHEDYEKYALIIKIVAILICLVSVIYSISTFVGLLLLATLWLQEGIWKTFQQRTESAIIAVEEKLALLTTDTDTIPYLFYTQWHANRSGVTALIAEYIANALKPTVIYPYLPLMLIVIIF